MNTTDRGALLDALRKMNADRCGYTRPGSARPSAPCDCKYGLGAGGNHGEVNGCPEMRMATAIVENLTESEWARVIARVRGWTSRTRKLRRK